MSKANKRLDRIRRNIRTVRPDELNGVLEAAGFTWRQEGSHRIYARGAVTVSIPQHRPFLKPKYVELALAALQNGDA